MGLEAWLHAPNTPETTAHTCWGTRAPFSDLHTGEPIPAPLWTTSLLPGGEGIQGRETNPALLFASYFGPNPDFLTQIQDDNRQEPPKTPKET